MAKDLFDASVDDDADPDAQREDILPSAESYVFDDEEIPGESDEEVFGPEEEESVPLTVSEIQQEEVIGVAIEDEDDDNDIVVDPIEEEEILGVITTLERARDDRCPPPSMEVLDWDADDRSDDATAELTDVVVGAAVASGGEDQFPIISRYLQRAGADLKPMLVRVDTEDSYRAFCAAQSPALSALADRVDALERALAEHADDPEAHAKDVENWTDEAVTLGADARVEEDAKRVDLWLPPWAEGKVRAWRQGDFVCASMLIPGGRGKVCVCTSYVPVVQAVDEISRHASAAGARGAIVGYLPELGCRLGAATVVKAVAKAAPQIVQRPEVDAGVPFQVRVEPAASPALCALIALALRCRAGDAAACDEWKRLAALAGSAAPAVGRAMGEVTALIAPKKSVLSRLKDAVLAPIRRLAA